ncbi:MAG TPA: Si-specific NAD(P)(+) transhydrogenase [Candidatus Dormibacteraeota bacterium]|nr:Si-specific NAD(P)(+) transhydrogenase [Candidatus Dormibacteraeota bacterium]
MSASPYDLAVIGSGPAGQKAAISAAKLGKRVAVVERGGMLGGVSVHTGTIPSKTFREAVLYLTGFTQRSFYGPGYRLREQITKQDLVSRVQAIVERETEIVHAQFLKNHVTQVYGAARFVDSHTLEITDGEGSVRISASHILIACGSRPARDAHIPFDGVRVIDTDGLPNIAELPRDLIIVGAGVIGLEYTSIFAALDIPVTLIDQGQQILEFADREIVEALCYHLRELDVTFRLGEKVVAVEIDQARDRVVARLESGKLVHGGALLYAVGRQANSDQLNLAAAGLEADARGRLKVDEFFRTGVPHIYAAGDVIGFPALAATSMEQGRLCACHMFGAPFHHAPELFPFGIYTIPEISMVGRTEEELTAAKVPYETGVARYEELAKAQMLGDRTGMLKLLFDPSTLKLLGVHGIGQRSAEIIHIGQAVLAYGGRVDYFRDTVFNYPTLAEAYRVAALNGLNKL